MENMDELVLMDKSRIRRSLKRIAYQIAEQNRKEKVIFLVGINERGFAVASLLESFLSPLYKGKCLCEQLRIEGNNGNKTNFDSDLSDEDYYLVLVDDVIFSGSTMFKALFELTNRTNNLEEVHTVVLVDRGHRKLPVEAEFTGMELPTKLDEHVSVDVSKDGMVEKVMLYDKKL